MKSLDPSAVTMEQVSAAVIGRGWSWFRGGDYDLNLVALRCTPGTTDAFDDLLTCSWRQAAVWHFRAWRCTTDPGKPALLHPSRSDGTAVIAEGQHRAAYTFGMHKGQYECLVPRVPIPVMRDRNRDAVVDPDFASTSNAVQIHRANPTRASTVVDKWSAGCVVLASPDDFAELMELAHEQVRAGRGDRFTLSLMGWAP